MGVLASIAALALFQKIFHVNHEEEAIRAGVAAVPIFTRNILITRAGDIRIVDLNKAIGQHVIVSRMLPRTLTTLTASSSWARQMLRTSLLMPAKCR